MNRRHVWIAAAAALVASIVVLTLSVLHAGEGGPGLRDGRAITATSRIDPTTPLFGDEITARIDVAVDTQRADPQKVDVRAFFGPLESVTQQTLRWNVGRIAYIGKTWTLRCLSALCTVKRQSYAAALLGAKGPDRRATPLSPAQVVYNGSPHRTLSVGWPTVEWLSRINQTEASSGSYFYHVDLVPPRVSYALSPGWLLVLLALALLALLTAPVAIARRRVVERRRAREPAPEPEVPPLERALRLLEWANGNGDGALRRRALELVAVELRQSGRDDLSGEARALAWKPPSPPAADAGALEARIRSDVGGNGAAPR